MKRKIRGMVETVFHESDNFLIVLELLTNILQVLFCSGIAFGIGTGSAEVSSISSPFRLQKFDKTDFTPRWVDIKGSVTDFEDRIGALPGKETFDSFLVP